MSALPSFNECVNELKELGKPANPLIEEIAQEVSIKAATFQMSPIVVYGFYGFGKTTLAYFLVLDYLPSNGVFPVYINAARDLLGKRRFKLRYPEVVKNYWNSRGFQNITQMYDQIKDIEVEIDTNMLSEKVRTIYERYASASSNIGRLYFIIDELERPLISPEEYGYKSEREYVEDIFRLLESSAEIPMIILPTTGLYDRLRSDYQIARRLQPSYPLIPSSEHVRTFFVNYAQMRKLTYDPEVVSILFDILKIRSIDILKSFVIPRILDSRRPNHLSIHRLLHLIDNLFGEAHRISERLLVDFFEGDRSRISGYRKFILASLITILSLRGFLRESINEDEYVEIVNRLHNLFQKFIGSSNFMRIIQDYRVRLDRLEDRTDEIARDRLFIELSGPYSICLADRIIKNLENLTRSRFISGELGDLIGRALR